MKIESLNNDKVKYWCKLKEKKYRDLEGLFLIEGDHLLNEALINGRVREIIAVDDSFKVGDIPFYLVTNAIISKLSSQVTSTKVIAVCEKLKSREITKKVCLLDRIQDPGNLGTIIRSAVAFDVGTIIMSPDTVDLYNEKVVRASEGMLFHLNFIKQDLNDAINVLQDKNYTIFGTDVLNGISPKEVTFANNVALIIGNEGNGMNDHYKDKCNSLLKIPISNKCESLNAGVAASILFYEMEVKI